MAAGAESARKRSRSYRPRINSFSFSGMSKACNVILYPDPPEPAAAPSSPVSEASLASGTPPCSDTVDVSAVTIPAPIAPIPPVAPAPTPITSTQLTRDQITQLTLALARQSSHQLSAQTRSNTKKNAGPLPFVAAVHRVLRKIRYSSTPPSSPVSSTTSVASSTTSTANITSNSRTSAAASAPASIPLRPTKTVSFSQTITILSGYRKADKWIEHVEKRVLPLPDMRRYPDMNNSRRRANTDRRVSMVDLPVRHRSDIIPRSPRAQSDTSSVSPSADHAALKRRSRSNMSSGSEDPGSLRRRPRSMGSASLEDPAALRRGAYALNTNGANDLAALKRRSRSNNFSTPCTDPAAVKRRSRSNLSNNSTEEASHLSLLRRRSTPRVVSTHSMASSCTDSENLTDSEADLAKKKNGGKISPTTNNTRHSRPLFSHFRLVK